MSETVLTIEEAARCLPDLVERIRANGEAAVLVKSGRPIARIVPVSSTSVPLVVIRPKRPFSSLRRKRFPPARWGMSSTDLLREERQER